MLNRRYSRLDLSWGKKCESLTGCDSSFLTADTGAHLLNIWASVARQLSNNICSVVRRCNIKQWIISLDTFNTSKKLSCMCTLHTWCKPWRKYITLTCIALLSRQIIHLKTTKFTQIIEFIACKPNIATLPKYVIISQTIRLYYNYFSHDFSNVKVKKFAWRN